LRRLFSNLNLDFALCVDPHCRDTLARRRNATYGADDFSFAEFLSTFGHQIVTLLCRQTDIDDWPP
jgi:hypothetical protein